MILVPLKCGRFSLIDDDDADLLSFKFHSTKDGYTFYATRGVLKNGRWTKEFLHRTIAARMGVRGIVDHVNRCGLDNRRCNLRTATVSQNAANMRRPSHNTSGFKGVTWSKARRKWIAKLVKNQRNINLGLFSDPADAARAYDRAARETFGEFAYTNFPAEQSRGAR